MPPQHDPLQGLRGLHLPPPVSFWPPAPGWWLLSGLLLVLIVMGLWWWRRHRRLAFRREALGQLRGLQRAAAQGQSATTVIAQLSILLRRVAISRYGRRQVAALQGGDWLAFLDRTGRTQAFSNQAGALLEAPYQRHSAQQVTPLLALAQQWIRRQR